MEIVIEEDILKALNIRVKGHISVCELESVVETKVNEYSRVSIMKTFNMLNALNYVCSWICCGKKLYDMLLDTY